MNDSPETTNDFYEEVGEICSQLLRRDTEAALTRIETLQRERPGAAEILYLMGLAAVTMDEFGRALALFEEAHHTDPNCFEYSEVLANLHTRVGNLTEGLYFAKLSTTLEPHQHVHNLLPADLSNYFQSLEQTVPPRHYLNGMVKLHGHDYEAAVREFDRQLKLQPDDVPSLIGASQAEAALGEFLPAIANITKAVELAPDDADAHFQAGCLCHKIGAFDPAVYHFKRVFELEHDSLEMLASTFACASVLPNFDRSVLNDMEAALQRRLEDVPARPAEAAPSTERKDRIHVGYVTNAGSDADFVSLLMPLLEFHDRSRFSVHLYQQTEGRSTYTQQLKNLADTERKLWELDDETASVIVCGDEIDILVDLCVPGRGTRSTLFAMAPSIIQVGMYGANRGVKMPGITHVISDPSTRDSVASLLGDDQCLETLRPGLYGVSPSFILPDITPLPASNSGHITFGAACDLASLTPDTVDNLVTLLKKFGESRLLFGASGRTDAYPQRRIAELFDKSGVADRVVVWDDAGIGDGRLPDPAYWSLIDIFLALGPTAKPLRYADALWMGVPVLTLKGNEPNTCVVASMLGSAARPEWVRHSFDDLLEEAGELSTDLDKLAEIRATMRDELKSTALFYPKVRVQELEDLYIAMVDARDAELATPD
ncbi:MAG: hypothetical protein COW30_02595 [Rhodospirillales bacterium CG15_BIG_FIL_POST_REV_8_21_14_020_66_15]|nr:MAG: hypothetical protein COW30_02595 [Rhodospirillales bacterium CG15_BIG_FIL_POST_REV_8_21_14_020_66_15]